MHHVMLHKSSVNVDVTYKVDVKFNVIGPRMKSGRISRRSNTARVSLRNYVTDSIRISVAWCINFDQFVPHNAKGEFLPSRRSVILVFTSALERRKTQRALLFIPGMRNRPVSTSVAKCAEEGAIYARSRSTALPEKSAQGAFWITVLQRYYPIYTPVNRILQETGGVYMKN